MDAQKVYVVIPNWNGAIRLRACLDALRAQTLKHQAVVVDNGSVDDSIKLIEENYPDIYLIKHTKNLGFTGGVNAGIKFAMEQGADYVALLNNDAIANKNWLENLESLLASNSKAGIATSKICDQHKKHLDSTGDTYTLWGLPYPRGRGEAYSDKYDNDTWVFGASGGASLYRIKMLEQIGLFDNDFFAYYEDIDLSFRAQLAGWEIGYAPKAEVYHEISATSSQIPGFATYHTLKNLPLLLWKNVPWALMPKIFPRLAVVYLSITASSLTRLQIIPVVKGVGMSIWLWPKKMVQRHKIQSGRKVSPAYINSLIVQDLPPNAKKLRRVRATWLKMIGRSRHENSY
jgi:GT2 family glycosyltransferase